MAKRLVPSPVSITDMYLAALLDEIKTMNAHLAALGQAQSQPSPALPSKAELVAIKGVGPALADQILDTIR